MKHRIYLAALLLAVSTTIARAEDIRACAFVVKARCASGDARVTLADGVVKRVEVNVVWCGLHGYGYTCTIDASRGDRDSVWSDDRGGTLIANASPWNPAQPDRVRVSVGRTVLIDFAEAQSLGRCGAGAELPRTIVIPAQKGACRVRLGAP